MTGSSHSRLRSSLFITIVIFLEHNRQSASERVHRITPIRQYNHRRMMIYAEVSSILQRPRRKYMYSLEGNYEHARTGRSGARGGRRSRSNCLVKGHVHRLKTIKRQMFGRGGVVFLGSMGYPDEISPDVELSDDFLSAILRPDAPIERAIADSLGDVLGLDVVVSLEVGDRARHPQDLVVRAG